MTRQMWVSYHGPLWRVLVESGWITWEVTTPDLESGSRQALMIKAKQANDTIKPQQTVASA